MSTLTLINIEDVKKGDYIHKVRKGAPTKTIFIKEDYCKSEKSWFCGDISDISEGAYIKKGKQVFLASDNAIDIACGHEIDND